MPETNNDSGSTNPSIDSDSGGSQKEPIAETIPGFINYLRWFGAEEAPMNLGFPLNLDTALEWFCQTLRHRPLLEVLRSRYAHVAALDHQLFVFPMVTVLAEKVLIPLHQAKVAFVLGHEFGCIALSGMVAEMLATLRFQVSRLGSGPATLSKRQQERFFGRSFEEIEHSRRVGILEFTGLIDAQTADQFMELSRTRNKYLHRLSQPHEEMSKDAVRAYQLAVELAVKILGLGIKNSRVTINPEVLAYIREQQKREEPIGDKPGQAVP